jgi:hypothetical protein
MGFGSSFLKNSFFPWQVDSASLLAALGAKSKGKSDVTVSYTDFMRHMAAGGGCEGWEGSEGKDNVALLEEARKRWKKTAERVRRHVQVSKEAEEQRARLREQEEARSDLFALRKQLGAKGIPFSARGHISARNSRARKAGARGLAGASRTLGAVTSRELAAQHPVAAAAAAAAASASTAPHVRKGPAAGAKALSKARGPSVGCPPRKPADGGADDAVMGAPPPAWEAGDSGDNDCSGKERGLLPTVRDAAHVEPEADAAPLLPAAAARRIQWNWRMHRGKRWEDDMQGLSLFPPSSAGQGSDHAPHAERVSSQESDRSEVRTAGTGDPPGEPVAGAKNWGWGGGIRAYVPKSAGTDASQLSHPPTPMTGHPEGAPDFDMLGSAPEDVVPGSSESLAMAGEEADDGLAGEVTPARVTTADSGAEGAHIVARKPLCAPTRDEAAARIQAVYREHVERQMVFLERQMQLQEQRHEAALRMQGVARGFLCRLRAGIHPRAHAVRSAPQDVTPASTQRSAARGTAPPTADSSCAAGSTVSAQGLPEIKGSLTRRSATAASAASFGAESENQNENLHDAPAERGPPPLEKESVCRARGGSPLEGADSEAARAPGASNALSLDLSKLPEPKDLRGKIVGQKGSVPNLRAGGEERAALRRVTLRKGDGVEKDGAPRTGKALSALPQKTKTSAQQRAGVPAAADASRKPHASEDAPAADGSRASDSQSQSKEEGVSEPGGREGVANQNTPLKKKNGGPGPLERRRGVAGLGRGPGGSSKGKKPKGADMMFLCDEALHEAHNQWALNALRDSSDWENALDAALADKNEGAGGEEPAVLRDSSEWEKALDAALVGSKEGRGGSAASRLASPDKTAAAAAAAGGSGGGCVGGTGRDGAEGVGAARVRGTASSRAGGLLQQGSAPGSSSARGGAGASDAAAARVPSTSLQGPPPRGASGGAAPAALDAIEEITRRLAGLNARGEQLQVEEERAAREERFHDAAALQQQWLHLRAHVQQLQHDLAAIMPGSAGVDAYSSGAPPASDPVGNGAEQGAPSQPYGTLKGGGVSGPRGSMQRRVGWVSGELERGRVGEAPQEGHGGVLKPKEAARLVRDEYGLPAPTMDSDDDDDDEVVQGVLQRRQEQLAATTGAALATTWAAPGSLNLAALEVERSASDGEPREAAGKVGGRGWGEAAPGGGAWELSVGPLNFDHLHQGGGSARAVLWEDALREGALSAPLIYDEMDSIGDSLVFGGAADRARGGEAKTKLPRLEAGRGLGKKALGAASASVGKGKGVAGLAGAWMGPESGSAVKGRLRRKSENASPYVVEARRVKAAGGAGGSFKAEMGSGQMAAARRLAREHVLMHHHGEAQGAAAAAGPLDQSRAVSR